MAIRLARHHRIPIFKLANIDMRSAMNRLGQITQTRGRRDANQELAASGRSLQGSPTVTLVRSQRDKREEDWWMAEGVQQARAEEPQKMTRQHSLHL